MTSGPIDKGVRVTGKDREALCEQVRRMYLDERRSVRDIAEHLNRSYGATHRLLQESGVTFRPRGNQGVFEG